MLPEHSRDRVAPARDDGSSPHHTPWRWAFRIHQDTLVGVAWGGGLTPARLCRPLVGWLGWNQPISVQAGNHLKQRSLSLIKDDKIVFLLYITRMVKI